jgi:hypothetical protein
MTTLLLANVGNHDVDLADRTLLPPELQEGRLPPRTLGTELAANYAHYAPALRLPLLAPTLRWLLDHEQVAPEALQIYLFASDQPADYTPQSEWLKDSYPFAQVIRDHLVQGGLAWRRGGKGEVKPLRLPKRQVQLRRIAGNPADYRNVLAYFGRELPRIAARTDPLEVAYLEVTGGTPAMTSMLIVTGVEVFGQKARTLYLARTDDRPVPVGVSHQLFARHTRATLRTQIGLHAYAVARQTLAAHGAALLPDAQQRALLDALLQYADRRLAFDFGRARDALAEAGRYALGEAQARVGAWSRQLSTPGAAELLAELLHSARIKYRQGDYADFVGRLFRFQEAAFRHLAEGMGMQYKDPDDDEYVDQGWVRAVAGLSEFLQAYRPPRENANPINIDLDRSLNRVSLGAIVDFFVQQDAWAHRRDAARMIHRLTDLARLRNKGIAGHGFEGIGYEDLSQAFGRDAGAILPHLQETYQALFERSPGADPYAAANALCLELLAEGG